MFINWAIRHSTNPLCSLDAENSTFAFNCTTNYRGLQCYFQMILFVFSSPMSQCVTRAQTLMSRKDGC